MNPSDFTDQELDRLKEIAVDDDVLRFPSRHLPEYGEVMKALPGLLRVCDAYVESLDSESIRSMLGEVGQ